MADAEATEGEDDSLEFVVTLSPASTQTVTVRYATLDGTATAGEDYTAKSDTLTFDPQETTKTVSVPIIDDTEEDSGETLKLTLSHARNAAIVDGEAIGTIRNTEANSPALAASFSGLPDAHDGERAFTFTRTFTEAVGGLSHGVTPVSWTGFGFCHQS